MNLIHFPLHSLKTRVTSFTLVIFVLGIWLVAFYASWMLRKDMQRLLGDRQFATVSFMAAEIDTELDERLRALERVAGEVTPAMLNKPVELQTLLERRPIFQVLFNGRTLVYRLSGAAVAAFPRLTGQEESDYLDLDSLTALRKEGKAMIARPVIHKPKGAPVFAMAAPIRDAQGKVIGALAGVTHLDKPNFLDKIIKNRYDSTGSYLLVSTQHRLIVTASDKRRIMEASPAPGVNPVIDRLLAGYEGSEVFVNPRGVDVLQSSKGVPVAKWYLATALPTDYAFAPIKVMLRRIVLATIALSLLAGVLIWWVTTCMLRRQFAPMLAVTKALTALPNDAQLSLLQPITEQDEVGDLISGFNHLLHVLGQREQALKESEFRWKNAIEGCGDGVWDWNIQTGDVVYSTCLKEMLGYSEDEFLPTVDEWKTHIHPEDQATVAETLHAYLTGKTPTYVVEYRLRCKDGRYKWILGRGVVVTYTEDGKPLRMIGTHKDITERKYTENQLRESEHKLSTILENVDAYIYLKDRQGHYVFANRLVRELFGRSMTEIIGQSDECFFDAETAMQLRHNDRQVLEEGKTLKVEESNCDLRTGQTSTYLSVKLPLRNEAGDIYALCGISTDITERKQIEVELRIAATAFDSREAMIITDANKVILRVNRAFTEITGYSSADVIGKTPSLFKSGRHDSEFYQKMWQCINDTGGWQGEVWDRRKNGELYPKWLTISAVKNDAGLITHYIGTQHDISERKQAEQEIRRLAFYDSLTQLPNRALLLDRLNHAMTGSSRNETFGAVLFIDLDYFKTLNDTLGHDHGDRLLQQVAQRLALCVREEDTVARLGGDEFVVILENLSKNAEEAATQTETIGEKMLAVLKQKYLLGDVEYSGTASIGASLFCGHAVESDDLLKQADLAMYQAKDMGRNALCFFDPAMQTVIMARAALENGLRRALEERQFLLYYQAQVVGDGYVTGAEVLVRWQHPERGLVLPAEFILFAEETGLILALGHWVLETACLQLAKWASRPDMAHLTLAVNVSAHQFHQHDFVAQVLALLASTGANPQRLKLELTESLLVNDIAEIIEKMFMLKAKGISFLLDDFGTGYSSLAYLKRLPLDHLKIDHSFVQEVLTDPNDAAIAKTIVALAQSLGLGVIAEGVETAAQCHFMATSGCHAYQGYFFSRPLPVDAFEAYVAQATTRRLQADAGG